MNSTNRLDLAEFEFGFINEEGKGSCSSTSSSRSISKYLIIVIGAPKASASSPLNLLVDYLFQSLVEASYSGSYLDVRVSTQCTLPGKRRQEAVFLDVIQTCRGLSLRRLTWENPRHL
jgi:hypothetical protein